MSTQVTQLVPDQVCYVHCNFCNTILAVNIPSNNIFNIVTVRCGYCANLLHVDVMGLVQAETLQNNQDLHVHAGSISECSRTSSVSTVDVGQQRILPNRPPEKRPRVPSAYNKFIKEEIQRIKANNPDISHREAFSAAAKNIMYPTTLIDTNNCCRHRIRHRIKVGTLSSYSLWVKP